MDLFVEVHGGLGLASSRQEDVTSHWFQSETRRRVAVSTQTRCPVMCAVELQRVHLLFQNPLCGHVLPQVTVLSFPCLQARRLISSTQLLAVRCGAS